MYEVSGTGGTDIGLKRSDNQDAFLVAEDLGLFLVSDGMGGHAAGDVASRICTDSVEDEIRKAADWLRQCREKATLSRDERERVGHLLEEAVSVACGRVFEDSMRNPEHKGMGCTLTALLIVADRGIVAHVGDSRLYLLRSGETNVLTKDHRVLEELKRAGRVTPERAKALKSIDGLSRAVGVQPSVRADLLDFELMAADRFLLCSDGLHGYVPFDALRHALSAHSREDLPSVLIRATHDNGAPDNVTAVVLDVQRTAPLQAPDESFEEMEQTLTPGEGATAMRFVHKMDALDSVPLFQHLAYQERMAFLSAADERTYDAGEIVMTEGEPGEHFYVLVSGECAIRKGEADIATVGPGAPLGDMSLVNRTPRTATVVALTHCTAVVVDRQAFFQFLRSDPVIATKILWSFVQVLTDRLARTSTELQITRAGLASTATEMPIFRAPRL